MGRPVARPPAVAGLILFLPLEKADIDAVIALEVASTAHPWSLQNLRDAVTAPAVSCKILNNQSDNIGYCVIQRVLDEAELLNFVIFRPHQSRGNGFQALQALKQELAISGIRRLFLEVRRSNIIARAVYEKSGFTTEGTRKNYYRVELNDQQKEEDALLMQADLRV